MDDIEDIIAKILKTDNIGSFEFKEVKIDDERTVYFIFKENITTINEYITNANIRPIAFIYHVDDEYYLYYFSEERIQKKVIKEFVLKYLT